MCIRDRESRVQDAVMLFESGFNCAQSVFAAYADLFGMDMETALKPVSYTHLDVYKRQAHHQII